MDKIPPTVPFPYCEHVMVAGPAAAHLLRPGGQHRGQSPVPLNGNITGFGK